MEHRGRLPTAPVRRVPKTEKRRMTAWVVGGAACCHGLAHHAILARDFVFVAHAGPRLLSVHERVTPLLRAARFGPVRTTLDVSIGGQRLIAAEGKVTHGKGITRTQSQTRRLACCGWCRPG